VPGRDVEPVELEPLDVDGHRPLREPLHVSRRWVAVVATIAIVWITIAFATRGGHHDATGTPVTYDTTPVTVIPAFTAHELPASFVNSLAFFGPRFAVSTGTQLFIVAGRQSHRVTLPETPVGITAISGTDILVRLEDRSVIIDTARFPGGAIAERAIPDDRFAIPAVEAGHWWYVRSDNVLQRDGTGGVRFPPNLRILAAVDGGFVALDTAAHTYVFWKGDRSRPLVPEDSALLAASPTSVAFARDCVELGCTLEVDDLSDHGVLSEGTHQVFRSAVFSPSGRSLAAVATDGRVTIFDVATGVSIESEGASIGPLSSGTPVSWANDNTLLVVEHFGVRLAPTANRLPVRGIQQVVALP
jgi:hypothetical protein